MNGSCFLSHSGYQISIDGKDISEKEQAEEEKTDGSSLMN